MCHCISIIPQERGGWKKVEVGEFRMSATIRQSPYFLALVITVCIFHGVQITKLVISRQGISLSREQQ